MKRLFTFTLLIFFLSHHSNAQPQKTWSAAEILSSLEKLGNTGSVLYIAAHPDDENTRFLAYCANVKHLRAAYLSMTRGDGGQNLIGTEQGEMLGLLRTQELLAARRVDGAEQYFTRANDFGYSKNPEETFAFWNRDSILSDVVWVIRQYRPDIIVTRFATDGSGGHGHHTASAMLAEEAFTAAADPNRFAWQLKWVKPWRAKRLLHNTFLRPGQPDSTQAGNIMLDVGAWLPALGKSVGEISAESRSMHRSQGFGSARIRGSQPEYFRRVNGDTAVKELFEGIDFSWKHVAGGEKIDALVADLVTHFRVESPQSTLPTLYKLYAELGNVADTLLRYKKQAETLELILACAGIYLETNAAVASAAPGDTVRMMTNLVNRSGVPFRLTSWSIRGGKTAWDSTFSFPTSTNKSASLFHITRLNQDESISNPYWLNRQHATGRYEVADATLIGRAASPPAFLSELAIEIEGHAYRVRRPVQYREVDPSIGELYRPFLVAPAITLRFLNDVNVFPTDSAREVVLAVRTTRDSTDGTVGLVVPNGWKCEPPIYHFFIARRGEAEYRFLVTPPANPGVVTVTAEALSGDDSFKQSLVELHYDHIPLQSWFTVADSKFLRIPLVRHKKAIGYIPGAGDGIPQALEQIGYTVTVLDQHTLPGANLESFDAIVAGIRAYNTDDWLPEWKQKLMQYVDNGGCYVVQYNTNSFAGPLSADIGPYPFKISRDRVTHEEATVNFDLPGHALFNTPNKITAADFDGWIQERGIYFANEWDNHYETPMSMQDPGEPSMKGSTLICKYGKGVFIYTGLALFRQLPAGVPGAYRLFVNMLEMPNENNRNQKAR